MPDGQKVNFPDTMSKEQITQLVYQKYPELNTQPEQPEWAKRIADKMVKEGRTDLTFGEKAETIGRGIFGGVSDLGGRLLSGATFGASDWAARKAGVNPTKGIEGMIDSTKSDRVAGALGLISGLNEMSGSFGTGGALYKGVGKGLSALPKAGRYAKYATAPISGAITGGAYRGFETDSLDEAKKGAVRGAILATAIDLGARGLNKALSSMDKVKGVKRGLPNTVESDKGTEVLNRAVKEDKRIAKEIYGQAPYAQKQVNQKMVDKYNQMTEMSPREYLKGTTAIVDKNGNPLKLYHGTNENFDTFKVGEHGGTFGTGIYVGDKNVAQSYGNPKEIYLNVKNPYKTTDVAYRNLAEKAVKSYQEAQKAGRLPKNAQDYIWEDDIINWWLKDKGYDGIIGRNSNGYNEYVVFDPKQIIPAKGGKVDVAGMKADAGRVYGDYLEANKGNQVIKGKQDLSSLKGTVVLDKNGNPLKLYHGTPNANFDKFNEGSYFTSNKVYADKYQNPSASALTVKKGATNPKTVEVYLNMKKPFDTRTPEARKIFENEFYGKWGNGSPLSERGLPDWTDAPDLVKFLNKNKQYGFDGIIIDEGGTGGYGLPATDRGISYVNLKSDSVIPANKGLQPKVSDIGINDKLSPFQKQALNKAWDEGAMQLKKGEAIGSMKHIDYMKRNLNTQIADSMKDNPTGIGKIASQDKTVPLQELKSLLKETTNKAVPPEISQQYALAKNVERAYNEGLGFQPNSIKTRNLTFGTPEEKSAFTQGLLEKMMTNESNTNISKEILKNQDVLKRVMPERNFKVLIGNAEKGNLSYERLEGLMNKARTKTGAAEPLNGKFGRAAEAGEGKGALVGAAIDYLRRIGTANSSGRAAKYLLNPDLPVRVPLYDTIQKYLPSSAVILKESKVKRKENK